MSRIRTVKQLTSKTTAVTCNAYDSVIETVDLTDAANGQFEFVVNNYVIQDVSAILISTEYPALKSPGQPTTGSPIVTLVSYERGAMTVRVRNFGTAALNNFVRFHFKITHN